MKRFVLLLFTSLSLAQDTTSLYNQALEFEKNEDYKNAMIIYKKIAELNMSKEDKYIID